MKYIKHFVKIILIGAIILSYTHANNQINPQIEKIFSQFVLKLEKKLDQKKQLNFLESLNKKISFLLENKKNSEKKKRIFSDFLKLSNEKIFDIKNTLSIKNRSQELLEASIQWDMRKELKSINIPDYITELESKNRQVITVTDEFEFIENNKIKNILFKKYFDLHLWNYKGFKSKKGYIILRKSGKMFFVEEASFRIKVPYSQAYKYMKWFSSQKKDYFREWENFYRYDFKRLLNIKDRYWFYKEKLEANNIDLEKSILYLWEDKKYNFVAEYEKVKLINADIIYGVTDKKSFLEHLINDKLYLTEDTDELFKQLKKEIAVLSSGLTQDEKIKKVYWWTLDNVSYTQKLDVNDKKIFSGILTYKNKDWVCEWYVKMASYALMFAGVPDVSVLRGDVVDAQDFPRIWHAWLKIGEKYYDPTFDDPIGNKKTKSFWEYKFFWLPRDLLYANRFNFREVSQELKTKSMEFRKNFVNQRLSLLANKYAWKWYLVLQEVEFKKKYNIALWKKITIEDSKKIFTYYEVNEKPNWELIVSINGHNKHIDKLEYFDVDEKNISHIFKQIDYDISSYTLLKWRLSNGELKYRLWFNLKIQ